MLRDRRADAAAAQAVREEVADARAGPDCGLDWGVTRPLDLAYLAAAVALTAAVLALRAVVRAIDPA